MRKYIIFMILLTTAEISTVVYFVEWREQFWNSVVQKNIHEFFIQLVSFGIASCAYSVIYGGYIYCSNVATILWRKSLNKIAYKKQSSCPNIEQRIQDDCYQYPRLYLNVVFGFCRAFLYLVIFSSMLYYISNIEFFIYLILYSAIFTYIAHRIARPLINLNYESQNKEASYRANLSKPNFKSCISVLYCLAKQNLRLNAFQALYSQVNVIIPLLCIAPGYFLTSMTFGVLMQVCKVMDILLENLSYGINSFSSINQLICCKKRLKEIDII